MVLKIFLTFCSFIFFNTHPNKHFHTPANRHPFLPFITGDGFRYYSDFVFDETINRLQFPYGNVHDGDIIFVKTDYIEDFFGKIHPKINARYILITHNSDYSVPLKTYNNNHSAAPSYVHMLDDPKIIVWFGQNINVIHEKLIPIPIGLENRYNHHGNLSTIHRLMNNPKDSPRNYLLYLSFTIKTNPQERELVYNLFKDKEYCLAASVPYGKYLDYLTQSFFIASPEGNGKDTHRTWESLYLGAIPIVKSSPMDPMFKDLPVFIIDRWDSIDESSLKKELARISTDHHNLEKLTMQYWIDLINSFKIKSKDYF